LICTYCGGLLVDERRVDTTRTLSDADNEESDQRWGTARFSDRMNLVLRLVDPQEQFVFDAEGISELTLGRFDASTQFKPEVDLQPYGATEKGVSRRHASIIRRDGALHIVDLDTPNGTYLNGQRLIPHQARVLRDGDNIRLGHLVLQVQFARFAAPA
jgi:hypothetical protein